MAIGWGALAACGGSDSTPLAPPATPAGLTATAASSAVGLTWTAVPGAASYNVFRGAATGDLSTKTKVGTAAAGPAFNDTSVVNATEYWYQVTAANAAGESAGSNEVNATPLATLPPAAPVGVTAIGQNAAVLLNWTAVPTATSYNIYWSNTPGVTTADTQIAGASRPYLHLPLIDGLPYFYVVTAVNGNGESAPSLEVTATPREVKPYIYATVTRWPSMYAALGAAPYSVDVCTDPSCATPVANATVEVSGTTLTYSAMSGSYSAASPTPAPGAAMNLTVTIPPGSLVAEGTYSASGSMYSTAPQLISPTASTTWTSTVANTVTWSAGAPTSTTPPSLYMLLIFDSNFNLIPPGGAVALPVGTRSYSVPANSTTAGTHTAFVGITTSGAVDGTMGIPMPRTQPGSGLWIMAFSEVVTFSVR